MEVVWAKAMNWIFFCLWVWITDSAVHTLNTNEGGWIKVDWWEELFPKTIFATTQQVSIPLTYFLHDTNDQKLL